MCYFTFTWSSFDLTLVAELCSCISFCSFCSRVLSFGFLIGKEPSQNRCWCSLVVNNPNHNNNYNNCSVQPLSLGIAISPLLFIPFSTNQPTKTLFVVFCLFCLLFKLTTNNLVVCCFFVCCVCWFPLLSTLLSHFVLSCCACALQDPRHKISSWE